MVVRLIVIAAVCAVAVVVALLARGRRLDAPVRTTSFSAPSQLDRADFEGIDRPWLVAVFTSETCNTCAAVSAAAAVLASAEVAFEEIEVGAAPRLHERYGIEAVPICVVADDAGVVHASWIGPVSATHLWGALAELREPGSVPPGCSSADELS